jgi:hypothetical protein
MICFCSNTKGKKLYENKGKKKNKQSEITWEINSRQKLEEIQKKKAFACYIVIIIKTIFCSFCSSYTSYGFVYG